MPRRLGLILNRRPRSIVELWTSSTALSSKAFERGFVRASCPWAAGSRRPKAEVRGGRGRCCVSASCEICRTDGNGDGIGAVAIAGGFWIAGNGGRGDRFSRAFQRRRFGYGDDPAA